MTGDHWPSCTRSNTGSLSGKGVTATAMQVSSAHQAWEGQFGTIKTAHALHSQMCCSTLGINAKGGKQ